MPGLIHVKIKIGTTMVADFRPTISLVNNVSIESCDITSPQTCQNVFFFIQHTIVQSLLR